MNFLTNDNIFNRTMSRIFDLVALSVVTIICCVPLVTAAASLTSMYTVMMRMYKNQEGPIVSSFFKELKRNFKGSIVGSIGIVAGVALLTFDMQAWTQNEVEGRSIFYGATLALVVLFVAVCDWYLAVRARFVESTTQAFGNAVRFAIVYIFITLFMGVYTVGFVWLVTRFAFLLFFVPFVGCAVLCFPKALLMGRKIDKYIEDKGLTVEEPETSVEEKDEAYDELAESKSDKKEMTFMDKVRYVLYNHIAAIIFSLVALVVIGGLTYRFAFPSDTCEFSVAVVNAYSEKSDSDLSAELDELFDLDGKRHYAYVDTQYQLSYSDGDRAIENTASDDSFFEKFFLNINSGAMDVAIVPESFFNYCNSTEEIFYDVRFVLGEDAAEEYADRLVEGTGETEGLTVGIRIDGCEYLEKNQLQFIDACGDDAFVLVFPMNSSAGAKRSEFVKYLGVGD